MNSPGIPHYEIAQPSLGECWLSKSRLILKEGHPARWEGETNQEIAHLTVIASNSDPQDAVIACLGDPSWLAWMHENFFVQKRVPELKEAPSYAVRLFNYSHQGIDQVRWAIEPLRSDPECRNATITTLMPLTDSLYIPCVSILDFWIPRKEVELVVYANGQDFGKKAYSNLVELALVQTLVAEGLERPVGALILHVKSAHIYNTELEAMRSVCESENLE